MGLQTRPRSELSQMVMPTIVLTALIAWTMMMAGIPMMQHAATGGAQTTLPAIVSWVLMLSAMMLPSEIRYLRTFATIVGQSPFLPVNTPRWPLVVVFGTGYLIVWSVFGLAAALLDEWYRSVLLFLQFDRLGIDRFVAAGYFFIAAFYQRSSAKDACLTHCQTPMQFFLRKWRSGLFGSLRMGIEHGLYCIGCCWALMMLMFAFGTMSLFWMAFLAALMFAEKAFQFGPRVRNAVSLVLLIIGLIFVLAPSLIPFHADFSSALAASMCRSGGQ